MRIAILKIGKGLRSILISTLFPFTFTTWFSQPIPAGNLYLGEAPPGNMPKIFPLSVRRGFFAAERIAISIDGSWTNPKYFGYVIDFGLGSLGPHVSPDNKYLFYTTDTKPYYLDVNAYWVRIDCMIDYRK
jgi:hypothetical protein